jgi:ABC-type nitrate/sulfonate/bicarbonate transport system permease component
MIIRQPISRAWRIGLGLAAIIFLLAAYTLLSRSRQEAVRAEQRDVAQQKIADLAEDRVRLQNEIQRATTREEGVREKMLMRLERELKELETQETRWRQLAGAPDAEDLTVPAWSQLYRQGLVRACTPQGSFQRKEVWIVHDFWNTAKRLVSALLIAVAVSLVLGLLMGCVDYVDAFFLPPFALLSKVPATAVLPIFFVLVQINFKMYIAIIVFSLLPTLAQSISQSVRKDIAEELIFKAYTLGASQFEVIWEVIYKQILPRIIDAARLQIGPALLLLVAAEWMVAGEGIGYRLRLFYQRTDMTVVFVYVIILGLIGLIVDYLLIWFRRWLCPWFGD